MECDMEFEQVIKREYLSSPDCLLYPFMDKEEDLRRSFIYYHRSNSRRDRTLNIRQEFCYRIVPAFRLRLFEQSEREHYKLFSMSSQHSPIRMKSKSTSTRSRLPKVHLQSNEERTLVYLCYIYMLCGTLGAQEASERPHRVRQLLPILSMLRKICGYQLDVGIFEFIIDCCERYCDFQTMKAVCNRMEQYGSVGNSRIMTSYVRHLRRHFKQRQEPPNQTNLQETNKKQYESTEFKMVFDEAEDHPDDAEKPIFKARTFFVQQAIYSNLSKSSRGQNQASQSFLPPEEEVKLSLSRVCTDISKCSGLARKSQGQALVPALPLVLLKEKLERHTRGPRKSAPLCTFCGEVIYQPDLNVKMFSIRNGKYRRDRSSPTVKFLNPKELLYAVEIFLTRQQAVNLEEMRTSQDTQQLFWNLIYYFNEHDELGFEFLLPYAQSDRHQVNREVGLMQLITNENMSKIFLTKATSLQQFKNV